ncbi:MAG TPA: MoaD/ThiS family protein [Polyangiaceae bacterium]
MNVLIPSPLLSYTKVKDVEGTGTTLSELLTDLERQYPGLRFRVVDEQDHLRGHIRFFVNDEQVFDMSHPLRPTDSVQIVQALSGG